MKRVYVAGPIRKGDRPGNIHAAIAAGEQLRAAGLAPFVPHLGELWAIVRGHEGEAEDWFAYDNAFLEVCDALLRLPGESVGSDLEVDHAGAHGIPVFHSIEEVIAWAFPA